MAIQTIKKRSEEITRKPSCAAHSAASFLATKCRNRFFQCSGDVIVCPVAFQPFKVGDSSGFLFWPGFGMARFYASLMPNAAVSLEMGE
jgi:hypothetical protein